MVTVLYTNADDERAEQRVDADRVPDEAGGEHDAQSCADKQLLHRLAGCGQARHVEDERRPHKEGWRPRRIQGRREAAMNMHLRVR